MNYNIGAYKVASVEATQPLTKLYLKLVALELLLKMRYKQASGNWQGGHDLSVLLGLIGVNSLGSHVNQLRTIMASVNCVGRGGSAEPVVLNNFPYLRYVMHNLDYHGEVDTDQKLSTMLALVGAVEVELQKQGVI